MHISVSKSIIRKMLSVLVILQLALSLAACGDVQGTPAAQSGDEVILSGTGSVSQSMSASEQEQEQEREPVPTPPFAPALAASAATPAPASPTPAAVEEPEIYEGIQMAELAMSFVGGKYVYGGKTPEEGFDCSGLTYYIYRQFGYRLQRVAKDQALMGEHVEPEDLLPGDILCFKSAYQSEIGHVGIYIGNGSFVHAMDSANGIVITEVEEWCNGRKLEARRLIGNLTKYTDEEMATMDRWEEEELLAKQQEEELRQMIEEMEQAETDSEETYQGLRPSQSGSGSNSSGDPVLDKYRRQAAEQAAEEAALAEARAAAEAQAAAEAAAMAEAQAAAEAAALAEAQAAAEAAALAEAQAAAEAAALAEAQSAAEAAAMAPDIAIPAPDFG